MEWFGVVGAALIVLASALIGLPTKARLRRRGAKFAAAHLAYIDSEFVESFDRAGVMIARLVAVSASVTMAPAFLLVAADRRRGAGTVLVAATAFFILVSGARLWLLGHEFPVPAGRAVVARARHVRVVDYLPRGALVLCWLCFAFDLSAAVAGELLGAGIVAVATAVVVGAIAVISPLYLVLVCKRPEAAVDGAHLYFQDAWRGDLMGSSVLLVCMTSAQLTTVGMGSGLLRSPAIYGCIFGVFMGAAAWVREQSLSRFRKRLWPELAPGQVLVPGQPVEVAA